MKDTSYRSPTGIAILLGIITFGVLIAFFSLLGDVTKRIGYALLFIPDRLGLAQTVRASEVQALDMQSFPTVVHLEEGRYSVYTQDYDLLVISDQIAAVSSKPWLVVEAAGGARQALDYVLRGLRPYDCPYASGRPVYTFMVSQAGDYQISGSRRPATISLLPDRTTGREGRLAFYMYAQLIILAAVPVYLYNRKRAARQARISEVKKLKHIQGDVISQLHKPRDRGY